jgi:hypothetical protein
MSDDRNEHLFQETPQGGYRVVEYPDKKDSKIIHIVYYDKDGRRCGGAIRKTSRFKLWRCIVRWLKWLFKG